MLTETKRRVTAGVDTHCDEHFVVAVDSVTGHKIDGDSFSATAKGYANLHEWLERLGSVDLVGIEGTGSYGAGLCRYLASQNVDLVEVDRPDRKARRFEGKSDPTDAEAAARAALSGKARNIPKSKDGLVEAIRSLELVHRGAVKNRTRAINQFRSLIITAPESLRQSLRGLSLTGQLSRARRFGEIEGDIVGTEVRWALKELSRQIGFLNEQTERLAVRISALTGRASPALMGLQGVGPHVAAQLLAVAGDNPERMRTEASFAKLCGVCPIPASSGKTVRHRLNRGGDRSGNNALYIIVLNRMKYDDSTRAYVARRTVEGKTLPEIIRCLKRFVAREAYNAITSPPADIPTGEDLRRLRQERKLSQTRVCNAMGTNVMKVSMMERNLMFDTKLALRIRDWMLIQGV